MSIYSLVEGKTTNQDMVSGVEVIEKAAKQIKTKKAGDRNELKIEHIIHAHPNIYCHIKKLFNLIIKHGHVPVDFKLGVIAPVIKDKRKDNDDVKDYRPVTLISVLAKLFEMCFYSKLVGYCGIQYGFEKGGCCERSISSVVIFVNYFLERQSDVYIVILDATAAFDRVNINGLLNIFIDRRIAFDIIRVLHSWYCI